MNKFKKSLLFKPGVKPEEKKKAEALASFCIVNETRREKNAFYLFFKNILLSSPDQIKGPICWKTYSEITTLYKEMVNVMGE